MGYQYSYLLMDIGFLIVWLFLFIWRKDCRRVMLFISTPLGIISPFLEFIYINDWWRPLTITGTLVGIEDFIFGFAIGGISAVIYEELFKKRIKERRMPKKLKKVKTIEFWALALLFFIFISFCYYILGFNTFLATIILFVTILLVIYLKRRDLIVDSLISGFLLLIISSAVYILVNFITPGWINAFWYFKFFPRVLFAGLPIEDVIFYFLFGAVVAPLYEFWQEGKLVRKK